MSLDFSQGQEVFGQLLQDMDRLIAEMQPPAEAESVCGGLPHLRRQAFGVFTEMNRTIRALTAIYNISKLLDTSADMDAILSYIVEGATEELGFDRAILYLISQNGKKLECKYLKGFSPQGKDRAYRYPYDMERHDCIETRVAKTGREIMIIDIETDPSLTWVDHKVTAHQGRKGSNLHVPILTGGKVIGVLGVDKQKSAFPITEQDLEFLKIFAAHAGIVMENARLHRRNLTRIEQLIMLNDIGNRMRAANATGKIIEVALDGLARLVGATRLVFVEYDKGERRLRLVAARGLSAKERWELAQVLKEVERPWAQGGTFPREELCQAIRRTGEEFRIPFLTMVAHTADLIGFILLGEGERLEATRELVEILSTATAITLEKARLMEQVLHEKNKSGSIISNYSYGIITTDCRGRVQTLNPSARLILGLPEAGGVGRHVSEVFPPGAGVAALVEANLRSNEETISRELVLTGDPDHQVIIVLTIRCLILDSGVNSGSLIIFEDVTLKREQKQYLQRLENLASLGKLSAALAHEIRNPIAGINVSLDVICRRFSGIMDKDSRKLMEGARLEVARLEKIVADLLNFARPERGPKTRVHLGKLLDHVILLIRDQCERKGFELLVEKRASRPWIMGIEGRVKQGLLNLLINAMQAMEPGGKLTVCLDTVKRSRHLWQRISIADTGSGIAPEIRNKIFDPFFTTRQGGTGLGLPITQNIMDEHGGEISFEPLSPTGTCFVMVFPKMPPSNKDPERELAEKNPLALDTAL